MRQMPNDQTSSSSAAFMLNLDKNLSSDELLDWLVEVSESISEALVVYDGNGRLVFCNQNFRDLYGYTAAETHLGVHFRDLGKIDIEKGNVAVGDEYGGGEAYLKRKAEYREKLEGSFIVTLKDGRWIKTTDRRLPRGGFVSVQSDISNEKKAEAELRAAKETAEAANRTKSEFLAAMSHDLRTPLNSILGFCQLLEKEVFGPVDNEKYREYHQIIRNSADHLLELVEEILDLSRLEADRFRLEPEILDPVQHTQNLIKTFQPMLGEKGVSIAFSHSENMPATIRADRKVATQVQSNLISNAVRHAPAGTAVTVRWSLTDEDTLMFEVRDFGEGFSDAVLENYGQPFIVGTPEHASDARRGFGLGLYICKRFVEAGGGRFEISNDPDGGAVAIAEWTARRLRASETEE